MTSFSKPLVCYLIIIILLTACTTLEQGADATLDARLRTELADHKISPIDLGSEQDPAKVALGQLLFFDKEISGNRDIACATCHHPRFGTSDGLSLSIGTFGEGIGPDRTLGNRREHAPRNATELFNRGAPAWETMFWDGRVSGYDDFDTPAEEIFPDGFANALSAQAMFPPTSRTEMRGDRDDFFSTGEDNDLSLHSNSDFTAIWETTAERLWAIDDYRAMFAEAYPDVETISFAEAADAIAAFEIDAFSFDDAPWDVYVAGDDAALTDEQKQGALLFYGKADCVACHSGTLFTNQRFHNIGVPQFGPGKGPKEGFDFGRFAEDDAAENQFAFRTPPLRNVTLTGPYMHNGAYVSLEDAVRHHLGAGEALITYDSTQLREDVRLTFDYNPLEMNLAVAQTIDPLVSTKKELTDGEVAQLMAFLEALTSPSAIDLTHVIPDSVPSGLPVDR